jgi:hypothetical protein
MKTKISSFSSPSQDILSSNVSLEVELQVAKRRKFVLEVEEANLDTEKERSEGKSKHNSLLKMFLLVFNSCAGILTLIFPHMYTM